MAKKRALRKLKPLRLAEGAVRAEAGSARPPEAGGSRETPGGLHPSGPGRREAGGSDGPRGSAQSGSGQGRIGSERFLPAAMWTRFGSQFRRATGVALALHDDSGRRVLGGADRGAGCPLDTAQGDRSCLVFHRKAVQHAAGAEEPVLFRCPHGFLMFGVPLRSGAHGEEAPLVLLGGPVRTEPPQATADALVKEFGLGEAEAARLAGAVPRVPPRRLFELARLARLALESVAGGAAMTEAYGQGLSQVMTLFEVASDLSQTASAHELYALALNALGVLFDVECAAILLLDEAGERYRTHTAMGDQEKPLLSWTAPVAGEPFGALRRPGSVVRVDDAHLLGKLGLPLEVETLTAFGLWDGERTRGMLVVINSELDEEHEQLIRGLAGQISVAIEKHRLHRELERRQRELEAVQAMSRQFLTCLDPDALFETILEEARKITGASKGSLMFAANGNGELVVKAVTGMDDRVVRRLRVKTGQGVAGRVFASGEPIVVKNVEMDERFRRRNRPRYSTKSFLSLPLVMEGRTVGVLNLADKLSGEIFSEADLCLLQSMAAQATIAIERSTFYTQSRELRKISITDPLTGLLNRRYFQERLAEEVDRATRHGHPMSLIMIDIDHFKAYNDTNGHPAGDKALVLVGRALRSSIRTIDVVSRFGGEEFAVILPETRKQEAMEIGERIRVEIERLYFPGEEALPGGRLTISLGVAGFPEDARDLKTLIQQADRALYQAKARGRNTLVAFRASKPPPTSPPAGPSWTKVL
ncbi:MAG: diguanylate cyclase [Deferrisomatales bacterium]